MTRAVVATGYGGPEMLATVQVETPTPGPGQVRLEVRAAGVNAIDYKTYSGAFGSDPAQLPLRLGREAAGIVLDVGPGATSTPSRPVQPGDEVLAYPLSGAYATEVVVDAASVVPKPPSLSFEEAGGLLVVGVTAVHTLAAAGVGPGDTVVIHGASGGVGRMAVQLAREVGARVIGTASPPNHADLLSLGAEPVTYGDGLLERIRVLAPDGVDAAIDTAGTDEAIETSVALVADRSRIVTIAAFAQGFRLGLKVLGGAPGADAGVEIRAAARGELVERIEGGTLTVRMDSVHRFSDAAAAHQRLASGLAHGKIVLVPDS